LRAIEIKVCCRLASSLPLTVRLLSGSASGAAQRCTALQHAMAPQHRALGACALVNSQDARRTPPS
jgi:hypothetical protein